MNNYQDINQQKILISLNYDHALSYLSLDLLKDYWADFFNITCTNDALLKAINIIQEKINSYRQQCEALADDVNYGHSARILQIELLSSLHQALSFVIGVDHVIEMRQYIERFAITMGNYPYYNLLTRLLHRCNQQENVMILERMGLTHDRLSILQKTAQHYSDYWADTDSLFTEMYAKDRSIWDQDEFLQYQGDLDEDSGNLLISLRQYLLAIKSEEVMAQFLSEINDQDLFVMNDWVHVITQNNELNLPFRDLKKSVELLPFGR